jgi:glycosyltransferase involved in cell wall biosynthesis|uniref:Glycosyltransferase 2-like domain-containing protein n=1 Tax=viral metagenome TaxID=1070528 RepID=A0A6C0IPL4_9ZZZZ
MGKSSKKSKATDLPLVSICTPTFNRRPFIQTMFQCFRNQDYPKSRLEWIIVDDGTDKIKDLVEKTNIPQIRYFEIDNKMMLGAKRNFMHKQCRGSIIVYMDDDDYYPPERVSHAVERLTSNPTALCAGSSEIYIYFKHIHKMIQCGPYGEKHATAGTFAFRKKLLDDTKYDDDAALAEERAFLKDYTVPFVQLDPLKSILVFSHEHNTYDKRKMFDNAHPDFFKESPKTVESFIRKDTENDIKQFFMKDIDGLLEDYTPGLPNMKPDVLKQIKEIEEKRDIMIKEMQAKQQNGPIMINENGKPPRELTNPEIVQLISGQQNTIKQLNEEKQQMHDTMMQMQSQMIEISMKVEALTKENTELQTNKTSSYKSATTESKLTPTIKVDMSDI